MRKILLLGALALMTITTMMAQRVEPRYEGKTVAVTEGDTLYLLHRATNLFYTAGNDWGTHATLGAEGVMVVFQAAEEPNEDSRTVYEIYNYVPSKNGWYYSFMTTNDYDEAEVKTIQWYLDGSLDKPDHHFCLYPVEDNAFRIYAAETNAEVSHSGDFADFYMTLDPAYYDGKNQVQTGTGIVYASAALLPQNEWQAVAKADYLAYQEQCRIYAHAEELQALIAEAEELGIEDLDDAKAAYENLELSYDEISAAISDLMALFTKFYEENVTPDSPIDMTRYVVNPGFEGTLEGWTNGFGLNTYEVGNWSAMIDGDAYTGSNYLNMWNSKGATGEVYQTVEGLPNGVYGVTIGAHSDAEGGFIFAGGVKTAVVKGYVDEASGKRGQNYSVVTLVTDGTLELGYHSEHAGEFWSTMDNIRLQYYGAGEDAYKTWVDKSVEQAPSFDGARCQSELISAYNVALKALQEAELDENLMNYVNAFLAAINDVNENIQAYDQLETDINTATELLSELFPTYTAQAQEYIETVAQPVLEAYQLGTDEVQAVIKALNDIVNEGQLTMPLFEQLMMQNTNLGARIEKYATTASEEALTTARALYVEVEDIIANAETEITDNEQIRALLQRIAAAIYDLSIPMGEASDDNPMDYTVYITNPGFEDGLNGWTNEDGSIATFEAAGSWSDGVQEMAKFEEEGERDSKYYLNLWDPAPNGYRVQQTITDLPNGTYMVSVTAYSNAENAAFIFAGANNVLVEAAAALPGNAQRYEVTTKVTDGTLAIGVILYTPSEVWCTFDDFTLTCYGPNSVRPESGDALAEFAPVGVKGVEAVQPIKVVQIFNLAGQRLSKAQKGVNIINGKKVLIP